MLAPLDRTVISNTPVLLAQEETVTLPSGRHERRRRYKFAETPIMSTYLVALVGETDSGREGGAEGGSLRCRQGQPLLVS